MSGRWGLGIFDLDGTLLRLRRKQIVEALLRFCRDNGYEHVTRRMLHLCAADESMFAFVRPQDRDWVEPLFWDGYFGPPAPAERVPGATTCLSRLGAAGVRVAVATARRSSEAEVWATLAHAGVAELVDAVASASPRATPKQSLMEELCRRVGCRPEATFAVGDATGDVAAARQAGLGLVVAVRSGHIRHEHLRRAAPDVILRDVSELTALLLRDALGPTAPPLRR